jgi:hypothetical protein
MPATTPPARLWCALPVLLIAGCQVAEYRPRGGASYPAKPEDCELELLGSHPGKGYEEIGVISTSPNYFRNPENLLRVTRSDVCSAGGDAIVTEVNGYGYVVRGVVFRKTGAESKPAAVRPPRSESTCSPICSPGFECSSGQCVPLCNPTCGPGEKCGPDRLCHPEAAEVP